MMIFMDTKNYNYFMDLRVKKYSDEWIAIVNKKVIAHGKDVKKVYSAVKKKFPKRTPLITKVPSKLAMIF